MPKFGKVSHNFLESLVGKQVIVDRICDIESFNKGVLLAHDKYTIIMSYGEEGQILLYKHAIESISAA